MHKNSTTRVPQPDISRQKPTKRTDHLVMLFLRSLGSMQKMLALNEISNCGIFIVTLMANVCKLFFDDFFGSVKFLHVATQHQACLSIEGRNRLIKNRRNWHQNPLQNHN